MFYESPLAARLYDLQHADDPILDAENRFLQREIVAADGRVLDLGCGTGRVLLPALGAGAPIVGCDGSGAFLELLQRKAAAMCVVPRIIRCPLEILPFDSGSFSLAFAAFRTFNHLIDPESREAFLGEVHRVLEPRGKLVLNTANPDPEDLDGAYGQKILMRDDLVDPETGMRVLWWGATRFDPEAMLLEESFSYDFVELSGQIVRSCYFSFPMAWMPHEELLETLASPGFRIEHCEGGFEGEPFEIGSGEAVWHLKKT